MNHDGNDGDDADGGTMGDGGGATTAWPLMD